MKTKWLSLAASALLVWTISATNAAAQERSDTQIASDVGKQINRYSQFTIFDDVNGSVENGVVTLTGKVTMPYKKNDIERRVMKVDGVLSVDNRIEVLPVSQFDDELRFRIARAIYGNSAFWHYASMVNPPIHIVVKHGRVRLTGVVQNNVERMLARSLATGFGSFEVRNDLKTDEEIRTEMERVGVTDLAVY